MPVKRRKKRTLQPGKLDSALAYVNAYEYTISIYYILFYILNQPSKYKLIIIQIFSSF